MVYTGVAAQDGGYLLGKVIEADKQIAAEGASVINMSSQKATIADHEGMFLIQAALGDSLLIRSVGYRSVVHRVEQLSTANEALVTIRLEEVSVKLPEVEVTGLPSLEHLMRNYGRREKAPNHVKNPAYAPKTETATLSSPSLTVGSPIGAMYSLFSREGKELRMLEELQEKQKQEQELEEKRKYNRFFIDNTGYEH